MKLYAQLLCGVLLVIAQSPLAQPRPADPIGDNLIPPELLMKHQEELGLTAEQKQFMVEQVQQAQATLQELQPQMKKETEALAALLKADPADEQKVLDQLDKLLDVERQVRRTQMTLSLSIRSKLTAEQLAKAKEIKAKWLEKMAHAKPPPQSLQAKMATFQETVREWQQQGQDLSPVGKLMQEFQPLMEEEKFTEAEAVLDKALELLGKKP
ncbi:MAG: Spy/CpxP family protein refolding chaperone [Tepidisphaerales bacterium]